MKPNRKQLEEIYRRLYGAYGPQHWWPADSPFEVMVGAILTQNTAWTNVEKAIQNLEQAKLLNTHSIIELTDESLAELIRPSGYFNVKAKRLKNYTNWFIAEGRFKGLNKLNDRELRQRLLSVNGVGPETADDILLYAFQRPVFVIDAYTRRLLKKLQLINGDESYETLRQYYESSLEPEVALFKEYHALIVRHAKEKCPTDSICLHCAVEAPLTT
ncbi:MAG: endonuclease III domain-containing protein [Proteobacteria bacterium]|nr:endonuclease III domain-containing protein [Pseudomonadota bacterium]